MGADLDRVREFAVAALRDEQDQDLQAFGVRFDTYYLESSLYTDGYVDEDGRSARRRRATLTRKTARSGSARRSSATTRIVSCASAMGRSRISCRTSRIT